MTATDDVLQSNRAFAERFENRGLGAAPAKKIAVLACMDARLDPWRVLGLDEGDAHVIRNAGGVVTDDAIRSLAISQHELGTEEIVLIHHTGCGMQTFTDEDFAEKLEQETGRRPDWNAQTFENLEDDVRDSIRMIEESPFVPRKESIRGFVYELETGRLREVTRN
jgi:carbonic anhydrase